MEIKTFEAFSIKDAVKAVKKSLGPDAIILSTREKHSSAGKNKVYEVTATASSTTKSRSGASSHLIGNEGTGIQLIEEASSQVALEYRLGNILETMSTKSQINMLDTGLSEIKALLIESLRGKDGSPIQGLPPYLVPIDRQLRAMGVHDSTIAELMRHLQNESIFEAGQSGEALEKYYRDKAAGWLMKRIKIAPRWQLLSGTPSIHSFVGTTGSGKTSLITKIAAHYSKKKNANVKVVSLDQNRLAATEQMRIFCKILGISFEAASGPEDFGQILQGNTKTDLVLVDTPGISPRDLNSIHALNSLRSRDFPIDFHLTISVTEKESQMDSSIRAFSCLGLNSLVFTKLDESGSYGEIFNMTKRWGLPLSFFGIGRDIPEDIERASRERVIERIFGIR